MKIKKEVKVGIVTTIALACFIYGFNFLKGKNLFSSQRKFYAVYNNIDGLVEVSTVDGFRINLVEDSALNSKSELKVITHRELSSKPAPLTV